MADLKSLERLRDCGKLEQFSTARHNLGFYNNISATAYFSHPNSTIPLQTLVYHALRQVIQQYSILSAIPLDEDTQTPYFARLPSIDLSDCVAFLERLAPPVTTDSPDIELEALLESQHSEHFKSHLGSRPFWRVVVLHSADSTSDFSLTWVCHHALMDGQSSIAVLRALHSAMQESPPDVLLLNGEPVVPSPSTPLLPPLEKLHPLPLSFGFLVKQLWNDSFPNKPQPTLWLGDKISAEVRPQRFKTLILSKQRTNALLELSRKHNSSITATIQCLIAASTFSNLDDQKWAILRSSGAISLRRFLLEKDGAIENQLGTFVGVYNFEHHRRGRRRLSLDEEDDTDSESDHGVANLGSKVLDLFSWTETQSVKAAIAAELGKGMKDCVTNLLRWVPDVRGYFIKKVGKERPQSFEVSNVGVVKVKAGEEGDAERWAFGRCVFGQCAGVAAGPFSVSVVTGVDGCAVLGFCWLEGVVQGDWMERVMRGTREAVEGLVA